MNPRRGDFWDDMVNDYVTAPGGWSMSKEQFEGFATGGPDAFFFADRIPQEPFVSPYMTEDTLVGEIVEDEPLALN